MIPDLRDFDRLHTRRVLTQFGVGTAGLPKNHGLDSVVLDQPSDGKRRLWLSAREVFLFSNWAIIRVLNTIGRGILSNMQFYESLSTARDAISFTQRPPDETWILVDFDKGRAVPSQSFGFATPRFLTVAPWVHLWGGNLSPYDQATFDSTEAAVAAFDSEAERCVDSSGISATLLFDIEHDKVLRLVIAIAPPQSIIVNWKHGDKLPVEIPG